MGPLEVFILLVLVVYVPALVVCAQKGRWVMFVIGLLFGPIAVIGAFLPARPDSRWAIRYGMGNKTCPRCAEEVKVAAQVCKHCGHEFAPSTIVERPSEIRADQRVIGGAIPDPERRP